MSVSVPILILGIEWAAVGEEAGGEAHGETGGTKGAEEFWHALFFALASSLRVLIAFLPMDNVADEVTERWQRNNFFIFVTTLNHFLKCAYIPISATLHIPTLHIPTLHLRTGDKSKLIIRTHNACTIRIHQPP